MKKFYTKLLLVVALLTSGSTYAQVAGLMADDYNPCIGQTVNISWTLGSGGGGPYFIQVGTTGPGTSDFTSGSQPSNTFQLSNPQPGQTYYFRVTGTDNMPTDLMVITTEPMLVAPTGFTIDGMMATKVCSGVTFDLVATGAVTGTKGVVEWSTDNITFGNAEPYTAGPIAVATPFYAKVVSTCPMPYDQSASFTANVDVYAAPTAPTQIAISMLPFCPNVSTQFVASGGSLGDNPNNYAEFTFDNGATWSQTSTYTATSGENVTADVRFYDACAMATVASVNGPQVFIANTASTPVVSVTPDLPSYCDGIDNVTFTANGGVLGTGGFYEYSINGGPWVNNAGSNTYTATPATGASLSVAFRITDDCGSTASQSGTSTAYVNPTAVTMVGATPSGAVCANTLVTYVANGTLGDNPASEYQYRVNGGPWQSNGLNNFVTLNVAVTTLVEFDIYDGCTAALLGTPAGVTTNIATNNTAPTVVTPSAASTCGVQNITFTTDGVRGDNAEYQYRVNGGAWTITPSLPTAGEGIFDLSITADATVDVRIFGGCNDVSATVVSTMIDYQAANVAPTSLLASAPSACGTQNITFTAQGSTLGDGAVYEYRVNAGAWTQTLNAGTDNFILLSISANTTVDMRILGGCNDVSLTEVSTSVTFATANVAPTSLMASAPTTCGAANITFTADGSLGDGATYEYSTDGGASWTATGNLGADNFIALNVTQDITVDFRIFGGCNDVSATEVQASVDYQEPSVAPTTLAGVDGTMAPVTSGSSVCPNTTVTVTASGYTVGDGATFEVATDGVTFVATGNAGADDFVTFNVAASTTYNVVFRLVGGCNGTQTSGTFTVTGFPSQPTVTSVTIDKDNICANSGEIVTFTTYTSAVVNAPYTYEWYTFDPITNTYSFLVSDNDGDLQLTPTATTTYAVRIEGCGVTSPYVATLVTVKTISVVPTSISVSPNDSICPGNTIALTA
ncbi:MAG TPA: hypothetical protein VFV37_11300, partial [Luteibaculaceae bacterium]|nr:hypothetical protein [Luteibaculaceae bacterium]